MTPLTVTAYIPKVPPRKGENLSIGIEVKNTSSTDLSPQVCALMEECVQSKTRLGSIAPQQIRSTSFNLDLPRAGGWGLEFLIGSEDGGVGYKTSLSIFIQRDPTGSGQIRVEQTNIFQGNRAGFGAQIDTHLSDLTSQLPPPEMQTASLSPSR